MTIEAIGAKWMDQSGELEPVEGEDQVLLWRHNFTFYKKRINYHRFVSVIKEFTNLFQIFVALAMFVSTAFGGILPYASSYNSHTINHAIATPIAPAPFVAAGPAPLLAPAPAPVVAAAAPAPYLASPYAAPFGAPFAAPYSAYPYSSYPYLY